MSEQPATPDAPDPDLPAEEPPPAQTQPAAGGTDEGEPAQGAGTEDSW